tara:strand:+ start:66 stop:632 length:567 start_codon:yes stop_codon:yes gene_type:complete
VKNKIRKSLLEQGQLLSNDFILEKNLKIQSCAIDNIDIQSSKNILLYFPYKKEITLDILIKEINKYSINIYMPRLISDTEMKFNFFDKNNLLTKNKYGIKELDNENYLDPISFDFMFIPFVGVDNNGYRLGYGGGYFDRALEGFNQNKNRPILIGLGYDYQMSEKSFGEPHDVKYDVVITENNILKFK